MKLIYIITSLEDEPVIAFDNEHDAEIVANASDGVSNVIRSTVLIEGGNHESMPIER